MRRQGFFGALAVSALLLLPAGMLTSCSRDKGEAPFSYDFIRRIRLDRKPGKPYSDYRAFYLLTEDFEPDVESAADTDQMRQAIRTAADLSSRYGVRWTHFIEPNTLAPAFVSNDSGLKESCQGMVDDLRKLIGDGDDCELHLHGPLDNRLIEYMKSVGEKHHIGLNGLESNERYRQRRSFFFSAFYREGHRSLLSSLVYGKAFLERALYDHKAPVVAFRPGGWDHGGTYQDTLLYYAALSEAGIAINSGLSKGDFGSKNWSIGEAPGRNIATIDCGDRPVLEVSPTTAPEWYLNPVLNQDLYKFAAADSTQMLVIVSVYHLGALQKKDSAESGGGRRSEDDVKADREALERHFQTVARLRKEKVLFPVTLRELLPILSEGRNAGSQPRLQ